MKGEHSIHFSEWNVCFSVLCISAELDQSQKGPPATLIPCGPFSGISQSSSWLEPGPCRASSDGEKGRERKTRGGEFLETIRD